MRRASQKSQLNESPLAADAQLKKLLSRTDWGEIQDLLQKKTYQRKFQIIEAFAELVSKRGLHKVSYADVSAQCGTTRQLVAHHFPDDRTLIILTYKYIYAGFQKFCSDRVMARAGFLSQLETYFEGIVRWTVERRSHARFLIQFYALVHLDPDLAAILGRNVQIGRERQTSSA